MTSGINFMDTISTVTGLPVLEESFKNVSLIAFNQLSYILEREHIAVYDVSMQPANGGKSYQSALRIYNIKMKFIT